MVMRVVSLTGPEDTRALGRDLAAHAFDGAVVLLRGTLGAGKTTLAAAFARALGVDGAVASPTYVLVAEYPESRIPLRHADLYRLDHPADVATLDLWDRIGIDGVWLVEWPDRAPEDAWPRERIEVLLEDVGGSRRATLVAHGDLHTRWLAAAGGAR